jgi:hypothetical protein
VQHQLFHWRFLDLCDGRYLKPPRSCFGPEFPAPRYALMLALVAGRAEGHLEPTKLQTRRAGSNQMDASQARKGCFREIDA